MKSLPYMIVLALVFASTYAVAGDLEGHGSVDTVLINSKDWKTVYYGMLLAGYIDAHPFFLQAGANPSYILRNLKGTNILLIEDSPQVNGVKSIITANGFVLKEYDLNGGIEIAGRLGLKNVIVVNPSYGYDAVSVLPYAMLTDSFVLFSDEDLAGLEDFGIIFYGVIPSSIRSRYDAVNIIDAGGRYENNIEIVRLFLNRRQVQQAVLTSGDFLQESLFNDRYPIIFTGKGNVPEITERFVADSNIGIVTLVGADQTSHISDFKRRLKSVYNKDLSVILLLGKSNVAQGDMRENQIMALETFPIALLSPSITIIRAIYNDITGEFEITIRNENDLRVHFLTTIEYADDNVGDDFIQAIEGGKTRTLLYKADVGLGLVRGTVRVVYGLEERSLDHLTVYDLNPLERLQIADESEIELVSVKYDRINKAFKVRVINVGDVASYVDLELVDVQILGSGRTLSTQSSTRLDIGQESDLIIRAELSSLDIEDNSEMKVRAYFGQREEILIKMIEQNLSLQVQSNYVIYTGIGISALVLASLIIIILRRKSKKRGL